ncbi:MAG: response regulator transcription factor [Thermodesulfobacteriota bacterium]
MDKLRMLIVEDNALFRKTLRESLETSFPNAVIDEAVNGVEALLKVQALAPDLIFMDIRLPGKSGLELTPIIKENYPEIIILILTNYDIPECRRVALRYGADHFISKDSLNRIRLEELVRSYYKI